ncbi:hypothetical protein [Streptomyces inhibens]|uniref:hypothetical protein n=1 Tax=Streptomyces inhibens TaxID=2293571 RepID=UPI0026C6D08C
MTSAHSNAPSSAPSRVSSGVIHIRTRQTSHFTVLANRLAQRAGSAVTVGVAAYILSLPDGAPITIQALCVHFAEGKTTIAEALRELEDEGWLERRIERGPRGRIITRTFAYDLPGAASGAPPVVTEARGPEPTTEPESPPEPEPAPDPRSPHRKPPISSPPSPTATAGCSSPSGRSRRSPRRSRSGSDRGAAPQEITDALTSGLPERINRRPARLLAHRLAALRPPARTCPPGQPERPPVIPLQNCDDCDRAFRAGHPGRCRDCRTSAEARPASEVRCAA